MAKAEKKLDANAQEMVELTAKEVGPRMHTIEHAESLMQFQKERNQSLWELTDKNYTLTEDGKIIGRASNSKD